MNCPVCARSLAPTLSICPSCGAMMYDTVREELQTKITHGAAPAMNVRVQPVPEVRPVQQARIAPPPVRSAPPSVRRTETAALASSKTSPTLVEFQNKNAALPDWRIQLQNAVQQRKGAHTPASEVVAQASSHFPTSGGRALKAETVQRIEPEAVAEISDPRVANAMRRITESRNNFLDADAAPKRSAAAKPAPARPYRFGVITANAASASAPAPASVRPDALPKPKLVNPAPPPSKRDTNKLPPIERISVPKSVEAELDPDVIEDTIVPTEFAEIKRIQIIAEPTEIDEIETSELSSDDIEDLAPLSMRFSAGLFDLIIGAFAAGLLLSPIAFTSGEWFTGAGLITFAGTWAIVSFFYMTLCLGFFGKTMGMRLFSLELVDAVENEYPTLHQAAVNSSVFILSLIFGGAGFLTTLFNEEKRALHDLLSGTILVREF